MITRKNIGYGAIAIFTFVLAFAACEPEPAHVHDYQWSVTTAATCIAKGLETGVCAQDATHTTTRDIPIDPAAHDYQPSPSATAPTCTEDGNGVQICARNATHPTKSGTIPALGHNYEYEETTAPTCTTTGVETGTCIRDQATTTRPKAINPAAHDWQTSSGTAPTCTTDGNGNQVCSYNNEHTQSGVLPKLGHDDGEWHTALEPDCTTPGSKQLRCTRDQFVLNTEAIAIDPEAHDWNDWTENTPANSGTETRICSLVNTHTETRVKMAMVFVPSGSFDMGKALGTVTGSNNPDETPVHTVTLTGFYIGKYEVTQSQWQAVMGRTQQQQQVLAQISGSYYYGRGDNYPIYYVNWYEALVFCNKLSIKEGLSPAYLINNSTNPDDWGDQGLAWNAVEIAGGSTGYRLPTEAQWEYAAKGGDPTAAGWVGYTYAGSDTIGDVAWYTDNNGSEGTATYGSKAVGTKAANFLGIYDMSGNVHELCWDWYGNYTSGTQTDPTGASSGSYRVHRGGGWFTPAEYCRSAYRNLIYPYYRGYSLGFRLLRPAQ